MREKVVIKKKAREIQKWPLWRDSRFSFRTRKNSAGLTVVAMETDPPVTDLSVVQELLERDVKRYLKFGL